MNLIEWTLSPWNGEFLTRGSSFKSLQTGWSTDSLLEFTSEFVEAVWCTRGTSDMSWKAAWKLTLMRDDRVWPR